MRWIHIVGLVVAMAGGLVFGLEAPAGVVAVFVLVVPFEKLFRRHDQRLLRPGLRTDLTYALMGPVLNTVSVFVGVVVAFAAFPLWLPALLLRPFVVGQSGWTVTLAVFLLFDVLVYWTHRAGHEVGFLWRFHTTHHSSRRMDWISGVRTHPFDGFLAAVPIVFLLVAGFELELVGIFAVVQFITGLFAHANVRWRLRPLHRIVMTPEFHHWHHANHPESIHSNYAAFLPIWDILWGTYYMPSHRRPERYGVDEPVAMSFPGQMLHPFRAAVRQRHPLPQRLRRSGKRLPQPGPGFPVA